MNALLPQASHRSLLADERSDTLGLRRRHNDMGVADIDGSRSQRRYERSVRVILVHSSVIFSLPPHL